jgi:hypothetical protein
MMSLVRRPLQLPFALPEGLAGVELGRLAADIESVLRRAGARAHTDAPLPADLAFRQGALPTAQMATFSLESDTIARVVVSHVRAAPFYAGLAMVVHPRPEIDAPLLVADVSVPPPGTLRAYVDTLGPGLLAPTYPKLRDDLALVTELRGGARRMPVPGWIAPLSGGCGARFKARPLGGQAVLRVVLAYVERYLEGLAAAPAAKDPKSNAAAARSVRDAVRANGPAGKYLARTFDPAFASRYLAYFWRDEA